MNTATHVESYSTLFLWRSAVGSLLIAIYLESMYLGPSPALIARVKSWFLLVGVILLFAYVIGDGGVRGVAAVYDAISRGER